MNQKTYSNQPASNQAERSGKKDEQVAVHGFQQVLEMLKIADPAFRESLLRRLAARDIELAKTLRNDLADLGL